MTALKTPPLVSEVWRREDAMTTLSACSPGRRKFVGPFLFRIYRRV